jgi:cation diffusion facilitator family transporter
MEPTTLEFPPMPADHLHQPHDHLHGVADPKLLTTAQGLNALKWSLLILAAGAAIQLVVVVFSGSIALLADMIHNAADATTAIPLGIAFLLARRKPTARFTYGYGRVEDLAGVAIVLVILFSGVAAGYEAVRRLLEPRPVAALGAVAAAGVVGFVANEAAAMLRIRVGRRINSAALIADGHHARVDGLASLAVAAGAGAIRLGYPIADPLIALGIAAMIFGIVWESGTTVFTRLLDGVEPAVIAEMRHAGDHVQGIHRVFHTRARWVGHRLHAQADIAIDPALSVREGVEIADRFRDEVMRHRPEISVMQVSIREARIQ